LLFFEYFIKAKGHFPIGDYDLPKIIEGIY